jgi:hypothetical protein
MILPGIFRFADLRMIRKGFSAANRNGSSRGPLKRDADAATAVVGSGV